VFQVWRVADIIHRKARRDNVVVVVVS